MKKMNLSSGSKGSICPSGREPLPTPPLPHLSQWNKAVGSKGNNSNCPVIYSKGNTKPSERSDFHHRCTSDGIFMEEQLSWLDDLLNEPDTVEVVHRAHRRSASDTFAYMELTAKGFDAWKEPNQKDLTSNMSIWTQNVVNFQGSNETKLAMKPSSSKDANIAVCGSTDRHEKEESFSQPLEWPAGGTSSSQAKPSIISKPDTKRNKQQSAHRSRVRKLQYIDHLERTVQVMQATGSKMSADLEFLDNQNLILNLENRALKQRMDSITQEQLINQIEHEMLERELRRLQALCQLQEQEQMLMQQQQQQQQQQNAKNRRTKNNDVSAFRGGPVNGPVQI